MIVTSPDSLFYRLAKGEGDIVAARLAPKSIDTSKVIFSTALYETRPVLVQLKEAGKTAAEDAVVAEPVKLKARKIRRPEDLIDEEVVVPTLSPYGEDLIELADTLNGDIEIVQVDSSAESLIRSVSRGEIDYTISQENLAKLRQESYVNIEVAPVMGESHDIAWAFRANSPQLQQKLNTWIGDNKGSSRWNALYTRYFVDRKGYRERVASEYLTGDTGKLSDYDDLIYRNATSIGWDWRLLAAQTYQESRFKPRARSWAGAMGLLQIMPATARDLGVRNAYDPEENVAGAVDYLKWLEENYWAETIPDSTERVKFILASYNAGAGHVKDAQRLAEADGGDPKKWDDVAYWLLRKSKREVFSRPVVRHGFCRGLEPVNYVKHILERYEHYRQFVTERPGQTVAARLDPSSPPLLAQAGPK